jgi:hypothetical protein
MTFSGFNLKNLSSSFDLGPALPTSFDFGGVSNLPTYNPTAWTTGFAQAFKPSIDLGLTIPSTVYDAAGINATSSNLFGGALKGIFDLPSILSIGKGVLQGVAKTSEYQQVAAEQEAKNAAAQQQYWAQYANQVAENYRNYQYQLDTYYRDLDYVQKRRDYEEQLAKQQAEYKGATATQAFKNFEKQIADLEGRFYEEEAKETVEIESIRAQSIANAGKAASRGQVGRSVERLTNQYHQQYLANVSNRQITRNFRIADKIRQAEALDVARQNTANEVQFYTPQPISDPVKPLAPLPITAVPPTPGISAATGTNLTIDLANIAKEAFDSYKAMQPPSPTTSTTSK